MNRFLQPVWVDAQLPPSLARRLAQTFDLDAIHVEALGLRKATDHAIYMAARAVRAVVLTKDIDFVLLQERHGPPPQIFWITCGNMSNARLWDLVRAEWPRPPRCSLQVRPSSNSASLGESGAALLKVWWQREGSDLE